MKNKYIHEMIIINFKILTNSYKLQSEWLETRIWNVGEQHGAYEK